MLARMSRCTDETGGGELPVPVLVTGVSGECGRRDDSRRDCSSGERCKSEGEGRKTERRGEERKEQAAAGRDGRQGRVEGWKERRRPLPSSAHPSAATRTRHPAIADALVLERSIDSQPRDGHSKDHRVGFQLLDMDKRAEPLLAVLAFLRPVFNSRYPTVWESGRLEARIHCCTGL